MSSATNLAIGLDLKIGLHEGDWSPQMIGVATKRTVALKTPLGDHSHLASTLTWGPVSLGDHSHSAITLYSETTLYS
jgi:hypothetical protein